MGIESSIIALEVLPMLFTLLSLIVPKHLMITLLFQRLSLLPNNPQIYDPKTLLNGFKRGENDDKQHLSFNFLPFSGQHSVLESPLVSALQNIRTGTNHMIVASVKKQLL